jgi:hypothetical protein
MKADSIASRELDAMFKEHKGNFTAICKALDAEIENGNDGRTEDQDAVWERFDVEPKTMRYAKEKDAKCKQISLSELIAGQSIEIAEDAKTPLVVEDDEKLEAEAGLENEFSEDDFDRPEEIEDEE